MTPKEKAEDLVRKYWHSKGIDIEKSIECALIAVEELIIQENKYNNGSFYPSKYWQEVKQEIEKL